VVTIGFCEVVWAVGKKCQLRQQWVILDIGTTETTGYQSRGAINLSLTLIMGFFPNRVVTIQIALSAARRDRECPGPEIIKASESVKLTQPEEIPLSKTRNAFFTTLSERMEADAFLSLPLEFFSGMNIKIKKATCENGTYLYWNSCTHI
jgi:hypothetical protein